MFSLATLCTRVANQTQPPPPHPFSISPPPPYLHLDKVLFFLLGVFFNFTHSFFHLLPRFLPPPPIPVFPATDLPPPTPLPGSPPPIDFLSGFSHVVSIYLHNLFHAKTRLDFPKTVFRLFGCPPFFSATILSLSFRAPWFQASRQRYNSPPLVLSKPERDPPCCDLSSSCISLIPT